MIQKPQRKKAAWTTAFPDQLKKLHPERSAFGGIRGMSQSAEVRSKVYAGIADLFKKQNPLCFVCQDLNLGRINKTVDVHHKRGRVGLLLFDVRYFVATCRACHDWIHQNQERASERGLLDLGNTGKAD